MKKIYILATVHQYESGMPTVMLDSFIDFKDAKSIAIVNAEAQKKLKTVVSEWVHDEHACELAKYYLPTLEFVNPMFLIETSSMFRDRIVKTYRAVFEQRVS